MNNPQLKNQIADVKANTENNDKKKSKFIRSGGGKPRGSYVHVQLQEEPLVISLQFDKRIFGDEDHAGIEHWIGDKTNPHKPHGWYAEEFGLIEVQVSNKEDEHNTGRKHGFHSHVDLWPAIETINGRYIFASVGKSKNFLVCHFVHQDAADDLEFKAVSLPKTGFLFELFTGQKSHLSAQIFENIHDVIERDDDGNEVGRYRTSMVNFNIRPIKQQSGKAKAIELAIPGDDD